MPTHKAAWFVRCLAGLALLATGIEARAAIIVTPFAPSVHNSNTAAMDSALGIGGFVIEDFENTALAPGLSYRLTNPAAGTFTALPNVFPFSNAPDFAHNSWDGPGILLGNSANNFPVEGTRSNAVTFSVAGGATAFGVGLSNFQSFSSPFEQFPVNDHELLVNGVSFGRLEDLAGWVPGRTLRNLYLRIDATGSDRIHEVTFANIPANDDVLVFDHLAFLPADAQEIPEPGSLVLLALGGCVALGVGLIRVPKRPS